MTGRVIGVTDGDTLTFLDAGSVSHKIRLSEIDAPEKCQNFGLESRDYLISLALNKTAEVVIDTTDMYGRDVAKVTVTGYSETVNKAQLRAGMAWVYDQYATDTSLDTIEANARLNKIGLWSDTNPIEPWVWRHSGYGCSSDPETGGTIGTTNAGSVQTLTVTEFYNRNLNHYFLTSSISEAIGIDSGAAGAGWERTGNTFQAWPVNSTIAGAVTVCRFYATGPNSHFFTANIDECQGLRDMEATGRTQAAQTGMQFMGWQYEGVAFQVKLPVAGTCPVEFETIYRAYNNRAEQGDTNHRFSPWQQDISLLQANGWASEGAAMCTPK